MENTNENKDILQMFKDQLVKILYKDGDKTRSLKGNLVESNFEFVVLKTLSNQFAIKRSNLLQIKVAQLPKPEEAPAGVSITKKEK